MVPENPSAGSSATDGVEIASRPMTWGRFKLDVEALGVVDDTIVESITLLPIHSGDFMVMLRPQGDGTSSVVIQG